MIENVVVDSSDDNGSTRSARVADQPAGASTPATPIASARTTLHGRGLLLARMAWTIATLFVVGVYVVALSVAYAKYQTVCEVGTECGQYWYLTSEDVVALREMGLSIGFYVTYRMTAHVLFTLVFWVMAALIFWRRSDNWVALLISLTLVTFGALNLIELPSEANPSVGVPGVAVMLFGSVSLFVAFCVFPDGRFVPRWTRWLAIVWAWYIASVFVVPESSPLSSWAWPAALRIPLAVGLLGTVVFAQVYRYLRVSGPVERQQIKWVVFGLTAAITGATLVVLPLAIFPEVILQPGAPKVLYALFELTATSTFLLLIPLSIGVAILRYRLWDIDLIINRTLVYGALTATVVGLYVLLVVGLGTLLQTRGNLAVSLVATGVIAVLFAPLRDRLQRGVNRLMYGERDEPYAVLSRLGRQLGSTMAPNVALEVVAETIARALKLPYAAVELKREGGFETTAKHGTPAGELTMLPLVYQGEEVGRLVVAPRSPGESFTPSDRGLLDDLAHQAGAAAHAVRLSADLQRSRERLVTAREEERRRLRRDLHDGLGPTLGALTLGLDAARSMFAREPAAVELLTRLKEESQEAVSDVRRLVYGLRPPALDDMGLVAAIRQQAAKHGRLVEVDAQEAGAKADHSSGLLFWVEAPEQLPPLPAAVEVACYRIAQEAINNVARHAKASSCRIGLWIDDARNELQLEITDDGVGIAEGRRAGVGMSSMRERAEELGGTLVVEPATEGGTRILARLPLFAEGGD